MTDSKKAGSSMAKIGDKIPAKEMKIEPKEAVEVEEEAIIKTDAQFILMNRAGFRAWLKGHEITRNIKLLQNHHTYIPNYDTFDGENHFKLLKSMKRSHLKRGFSDIAQNITTFPDGMIAVCRPINTSPAGIKGANSKGVCIEHVGDFDKGNDEVSEEHKKTILWINAIFCQKLSLDANTNTIVYHHWYDLKTGKRKNGEGTTKSCPGTAFFGGNKVEDAQINFIPKIIYELKRL